RDLDLDFVTDLLADQKVGGGITWASGELPLLLIMTALAVQWYRSDSRAATQHDRRADRDEDAELAAYNEMLHKMALVDAGVTEGDAETAGGAEDSDTDSGSDAAPAGDTAADRTDPETAGPGAPDGDRADMDPEQRCRAGSVPAGTDPDSRRPRGSDRPPPQPGPGSTTGPRHGPAMCGTGATMAVDGAPR